MMRFIVAALISLGAAHMATAQSLGDVAKKEESRRKAVKSNGKVYTNDSLKPEPEPSAATPASASSGQPAAPAAAASPDRAPEPASAVPDKGDEKSWRKRVADARDALQRSQTFAGALQSQLNALTTDFVNRDDPVQRSVIAVNRDKVAAELDRVTKEIAEQTRAIADIQEEARRAGVPAGWVR
jgi:hypothetical protein